MTKEFLIKLVQTLRHENNHILRTMILLTALAIGTNISWGETVLGSFTFTSANPTPTEDGDNAGDDKYELFSDANMSITAQGLKTGDANRAFQSALYTSSNIRYQKLQSGDKSIANFKIQFKKGYLKAGDIIKVNCGRSYENGDLEFIGYIVDKGRTIQSNNRHRFTDGTTEELAYTITGDEIQSANATDDYILIYRLNSGAGYGGISVERIFRVNVNRSNLPTDCDAWFTIGDNPTKYRTEQIVEEGTTVTYTMVSNNHSKLPEGWRTSGWHSHDLGWMGYSSTFTTTVRNAPVLTEQELTCGQGNEGKYAQHEKLLSGNLNPEPVFINSKWFKVFANAEEGGTATVSDASGHNMNDQYTGTTGQLTFTATPAAGFNFEGWYNTSGTRVGTTASWNSGTYGNTDTDVDLVYTAKFTPTGNRTITFSSQDGEKGTVTATVGSTPISSGDKVAAGSVITFTATPADGKYFWLWRDLTIDDDQEQIQSGVGSTWNVTVTKDMIVRGDFHDGVTFSVGSNNSSWGNVHITKDEANVGTSFTSAPYPQGVKFVATPNSGYEFVGWYSNAACTNEYNGGHTESTLNFSQSGVGTSTDKTFGCTIYAKFEEITIDHPVIDCVNKTIDLTKVTASSGCTYSNGTGTMNEANAYLRIKFASPIDMHELSSIAIAGTNLDKNAATPGVIDNVRFYYEGGDFGKFNSPTNITSFSDEQKENLKTVSEIRIFNGSVTGEFTISSITFNFGGSHVKKAAPTFKDGTASNMTITVGDDLKLSVNEGDQAIWREYANGTDWTQGNQTYTHIAQDNYHCSTTVISGLAVGTYYFAAEIPNECAFGHNHGSDLVKVIVTVKAAEEEPNVYMYDLSNFPGKAGNVTNVTKNVVDGITKSVEVTTTGSSNNYLKLLDGPIDSKYTGVRVDTKGAAYRVIIKTSDSKTFIYKVPANDGDYVTKHIVWSEFTKQWESTKMTDADVAKITEIGLGGNDVDHSEETFYVRHLWLDDIKDNDYNHALVLYGEEYSSWDNWNEGKCDYTYTTPDKKAKVEYKGITADDHTDRSGKNCIILRQGREVFVTPPSGYKIATMRVTFSEKTTYSLSFNSGNGWWNKVTGYYVDYTNTAKLSNGDDKTDVRMVILGGDDYKDDALKISKIEFTLEALKIEETKTLANENPSNDRQYRVYAPAKVLDLTKIPVVFSLHGGDGDWAYETPNGKGVMNFNDVANNDEQGFIVVYPRGGFHRLPFFKDVDPATQKQTPENRNWLSTGEDNDDIEYLKDIIADLKKDSRYGSRIDESRIYITGYSNGGMMAYAAANAAADVFAAFSSISGLPMNDFHLQHHGVRPVPFLHIHGTKDGFVNVAHMPTIIDNMVARNGVSYIPVDWKTVRQGEASFYGNPTKYDKYVYSSDGYESHGTPFVYYSIGTGMTASDTGMGHNMSCEIDGIPNTQVIWNFFKNFTLPSTPYDKIEFNPSIIATSNATTNDNKTAIAHGWTVNEGQVIASYGESGGYADLNQGVYHSLQLNGGVKHYIKFTAKNSDASKTVTVRLTKLGELDKFNDPAVSFSPTNEIVLEKYYSPSSTGADIVVEFDATEMTGGEYNLAFLRSSNNDMTTISNVVITTAADTPSHEAEKPFSTDFTGWFSYENRLVAQWDFDLCDGPRFITSGLDSNWDKDYDNTDTGNASAKFGSITYIYKPELEDFEELYYDNEKKYRIPVSAGILFKGPSNSIKIKVELANGIMKSTQLVLEKGVQIGIPYAVNSYRSDAGTVNVPLKNKLDGEGNVVKDDKGNDVKEIDYDHYYEFQNCMHHIKRDIIYIAAEDGDIWKHIDKYLPGTAEGDKKSETQKYNSGGDEFINGKTFNKLDYWGTNDEMAVIDITSEAKIDRIAVNRNSTYSLYTQYLSKAGYDVPEPGLRILGTGKGLKVASVSESGGYYTDCLAITYGGWGNNSNGYEDYNGNAVTDSWSALQTYDGENKTIAEVPIPSDGFYSMSINANPAHSETLMPQGKEDSFYNQYHGAWNGNFKTTYKANVTPWTLPCRGGFVKFEPTIPGVLNAHVFQSKGETYYIADEFGNLITDNTPNASMFHKTGTAQDINGDGSDGYSVTNNDYVKYSFNVYPGKSYYIFSNNKGIGFMGAFFEPFVCRMQKPGEPLSELGRGDIELATLKLDETKAYALVDNIARSGEANLIYPNGAVANPDGAPGVFTRTIYSPKAVDGVVTPKDNTDFSDPTKWQAYQIHSSKSAVDATVNRSFTKDTWNSICLPFSMNHMMLENVFGKGTVIVMLRDVQPGSRSANGLTTANFIYHENQDIIAGYPYLICPAKNVSSIKCNASLYDTTPSIVSVGGEGFNTTTGEEGNYGGLSYYEFGGTFEPITLPQYSYVMSSKGNLSRQTKAEGVNIKAYRAYLKYKKENDPTPLEAKPIQFVSFGGEDIFEDNATDVEQINIEELLFNSGILAQPADVYNMSGMKVRSNVRDLRDLTKGAYIVNGKKFIVK